MYQQGKQENFNENTESFECFDSEEVKSCIQNNNNKFQLDKRKYFQSKIINQGIIKKKIETNVKDRNLSSRSKPQFGLAVIKYS